MKKIRLITALLAAAMLLGSLAACARPEPEEPTSSTQATTEQGTTPVIKDDLPTLDFKDEEIVMISRYREGWTSGEISVERRNGEPVNDAVYERNKAVEERLHVKITSLEEQTDDPFVVVNKVATAVSGGSHEYDIMAAACYTALNESLNGTFANLRRSEHLDFDKPYWTQGFNEVVEYDGAQYAATGAMLLSVYRFSFVTVFNKDLFDSVHVPYLYEDVANKTWTLDRQAELIPLFHRDNGNNVQDKQGDVYGFVSSDYLNVDPYWSSCKVDIIQKDENGDYELVFESGKLHGVAEKVLHLFYGTGAGMYNHEHLAADNEQAEMRNMFADGYAAMSTLRVLELESSVIRNMKSEFGVVPMPKYDNAQDGYRTLMHDQFTVLCVPTTAANRKTQERLDMAAAVLEAMASDSYNSLKPAYYETTLRTKIAQDPQSAEMLDLIFDHIYIDAGIIYTQALSVFHDRFRHIMKSKQNTVVSDYKSLSGQVEKNLKTLTKALDKLARSKG